jgi:hypothetical protein
MSVFAIVFEGSAPIGGILAGTLAASLGGAASFVVTGVAALVLAAAAAPLLARVTSARRGASPVPAGPAGPPP